MKIISKYKDYYDYLVGVFGMDESFILDRTEFLSTPPRIYDGEIITIHIGEWKVQGYCMGGKIYYGDEVKGFSINEEVSKYLFNHYDGNKNWILPDLNGKHINNAVLKKPEFIGDKSPTWAEDCPILLNHKYSNNIYNKNPILKDYGIPRMLEPKDVWIILSEWLGKRKQKNEPEVPVGDDKVRIQSAGFDLKTSFRHRKDKV